MAGNRSFSYRIVLGISLVAVYSLPGLPLQAHDHATMPSSNTHVNTPHTQRSIFEHHTEQNGVGIDFSLAPLTPPAKGPLTSTTAGEALQATFTFSDSKAGTARADVQPKAWLSLRRSEQVANELSCTDKVKGFLQGQLSARADVDLNAYWVLVLNHDNSISYINPQVTLSTSKLERLVPLPGQGRDWTLSRDQEWLYVTLPSRSSVAVIRTATGEVVREISTGVGTTPSRITLQPDGRYVWVGLDESPMVTVIEAATHKLVKHIPIGLGLHTLAISHDSRFVVATNTADHTATLIDIAQLTRLATLPVSKTPVALAYSRATGHFYAAGLNGGEVTVIDPQAQRVTITIPTNPGVVALKFEPEGRLALAVNQLDGTVSAFDATSETFTASARVVKEPDQVTFSHHFAYVRGIASEKFSLIDLSLLRKGSLAVTDIQAGHTAPQSAPGDLNVADMTIPTPEGHGALIANAAEQTLYYYMEGMMVPMGTLQTYQRHPRGILILDRSLAQTKPGAYVASIKFPRGGQYDVHLLTESPPLLACFPISVMDAPRPAETLPSKQLLIQRLFDDKPIPTGKSFSLRFRILSSTTNQPVAGLQDVQVLLFEPPGIWQQRLWAQDLGNGTYEALQAFPHSGQYRVTLQILSHQLKFDSKTATTLTVHN